MKANDARLYSTITSAMQTFPGVSNAFAWVPDRLDSANVVINDRSLLAAPAKVAVLRWKVSTLAQPFSSCDSLIGGFDHERS